MKGLRGYIGDKAFYKMIFAVALPIMFQNLVTNLVSLVDNFMVGLLGTEQTSGVAIANQIIFVFTLTIFGAVSGPGVFTAQYYGKKDKDGIRYTMRYKMIACVLVCVVFGLLFFFEREWLIDKFIHVGNSETECDILLETQYAKDYLVIMLAGFIPFILTQVFATTMRETGDTLRPMIASFIAVGVNCILNYILIFGKLGVPEEITGVRGAAIATVISRFTECAVVIFWMIRRKKYFTYLPGAFRSLKIPKKVFSVITKKGMPLVVNEFCWSFGTTLLGVCFSYYGGNVVAGYNICSTVWNVFTISFIAFGTAIGVVAGKYLGAREFDKAEDAVRKMMTFSFLVSLAAGIVMFFLGSLVPLMYKVSPEAKETASSFIRICAFYCPVVAIVHASYFTVRSGGKTLITFIFDSFYTLFVQAPVAFAVYFLAKPSVVVLYIVVQSVDIVKCIVGMILVKKKIWVRDLV